MDGYGTACSTRSRYRPAIFCFRGVRSNPISRLMNLRCQLGMAGRDRIRGDWFHISSVQSSGAGYLVSSRHTSTVYMLFGGGDVQWRLQVCDCFPLEASKS